MYVMRKPGKISPFQNRITGGLMNIIVSTMGKHLEIGARIVELLKERVFFEKIGFLVANSKYFKRFNNENSFLKDHDVRLVKEWEYTRIPRGARPDLERIISYEKRIGDPTFWNALMADRRIFFGKYCNQWKLPFPIHMSGSNRGWKGFSSAEPDHFAGQRKRDNCILT